MFICWCWTNRPCVFTRASFIIISSFILHTLRRISLWREQWRSQGGGIRQWAPPPPLFIGSKYDFFLNLKWYYTFISSIQNDTVQISFNSLNIITYFEINWWSYGFQGEHKLQLLLLCFACINVEADIMKRRLRLCLARFDV